MRRLLQFALLVVASLLILPLSAHANEAAQGWCEDGDTQVVTSGLTSTTTVQGSFPQCTVTVYLQGTMTLATIYSDNNNTALTNPFSAATNGQWEFYAAQGRYDITLSGGGLPVTVTLPDILLFDPANATFPTLTVTGLATFSGLTTFSGGVTGSGTLGALTAGPGILNGNNAWTGNETHSGTESFSGGGDTGTLGLGSTALGASNTWTGTNAFTGTTTFNSATGYGLSAALVQAAQNSADTNFGTALSTQIVIPSVSSSYVLMFIGVAVVQTQIGVGCSATSNTAGVAFVVPSVGRSAPSITGPTLTITGNGSVGLTSFEDIPAVVGGSGQLSYTTLSVLGSTGCSTTPQYAVYVKVIS